LKEKGNWVYRFRRNAQFCLASAGLFFSLMIPVRALSQTTAANTTDRSSAENSVTASTALPDTPQPAPQAAPAPAPPKPQEANDGAPSDLPATVVNDEFPHWLHFSGEYRIRPEEHTAYSFTPGKNDGFVLSRLRLNIELRPTSWFSTFVQAQDSEAGGIQPAHITPSVKDVFDLRQAYLEFRDGEKGWFRLRIGREEFRYGQERLIGVSDWTNAPRVFDAVRLTIGPEKAHVDVFTSAVVVNYPTSFDTHPGGFTFHGIYGSLSDLVPKAKVEPYVLWKALPVVTSEEGKVGHENLWTYGFRWIGKLPFGFDYTTEAAKQGGNYSTDSIQSWGGYAIAGYSPSHVPLKPRFSAQYDYASGDNKKKDGIVGTFDQLYPSNHDVFGLVDLFGWRNIRQMRAGLGVKPTSRLGVNFDFRDLMLANRHDSLYGSTGSVLVKVPTAGAAHVDIGQEPELSTVYLLRRNITTGAGYAYLFAGRFLTENTPGERATIVYVFTTYRF
jgi:hypothetical protein